MHIPQHYRQDERGDTIVEVLVALAIISLVLAGAFFAVNRNAQNILDSEEHSQALQQLQGQIERVRADAVKGATDSDYPSYFCYDKDGAIQTATSATDYSQCSVDLTGTSTGMFTFVIAKTSAISSDQTTLFNASVHWDGLHGQTNSENLLYKVQLAP